MWAQLKRFTFASLTTLFGDANRRVLLPVLRGPARGLRFRLDLQRHIESAYCLGTYELGNLRRLQSLCEPGWTIWDCGAYLGYYTASFARFVGPSGRVVAFEPDPRNMARTQDNLMLNHLANVQFVSAAIAAPGGQIDFVLSDNTNSHIAGTWVGAERTAYSEITERRDGTFQVRCLSLDEAFRDTAIPRPNLIKLDIEGAEIEALRYTRDLVREAKPLIALELHNPDCDAAAWYFAQMTGYSLRALVDGRVLRSRDEVRGTVLCVPPA